ncbi:unnamed protein product (macronuclear) [Paramecium tetraurelia]|uniref:Uncharacterized protein n=1 Tax=Paramecium tetraurelia TaxID=5888 RepID=A0DLX0_PARTE|nr:uncharacterized protein GSPATT00018255001 [Paramecium tetraurelia]CAK84037.1 unnamed protein product [Paramecium tetraurelia]|eukprot:XP_001451434.1 hypothetical protein (macronuclear) [Paramecium tetraurelia strain d4-2]
MMILTGRRKSEKIISRSLRPSLFLNEFDLSSMLQTSSVKTEANINQVSKTEAQQIQNSLSVIPENPTFLLLPQIEEKFVLKSKEVNFSKEKRESKLLKNVASEQLLQQSKLDLKLPLIQQSPQIKTLPRHSRQITSEDLKKVEFRPSIMVIDFINNIVKKDKIDGSSKPLTKKLQRQQTRFIKQSL